MEEQTVTDLDIQALVDGELGWDAAQKVRDYLVGNAIACQRYRELMEQKHLISEWWQRQKAQQN